MTWKTLTERDHREWKLNDVDPYLICRRHHEEHFCEIILNLEQWFWSRCHLKDFLSIALADLMFSRLKQSMQFWWRT